MIQNKNKYILFFTMLLFLLIASPASAQNPCPGGYDPGNPCPCQVDPCTGAVDPCNGTCSSGPPPPPPGNVVPIDGGILTLLFAGLFYGVKKSIKKK
jgi:hypothetical protein